MLAPVFRDGAGVLRILLLLRTDRGIHGGQLGLPGGRPEPADQGDFLATALREAEEEVGLLPSQVEVLAALDPLETMATGFRVYPFLGLVPRRRVAAPARRGRTPAHSRRRGSRRGDRAETAAVHLGLLRPVDRGRGHRGRGSRALGHDAAAARRPRAAVACRRVGRVGRGISSRYRLGARARSRRR